MVSIFTFTFTSHSHGINIRHIPYDTADRKLTSKIVTNAVRPRPSQGECPVVTSGQDTSAREDSAPRATQDSSNGTPTNSLFKKWPLSIYYVTSDTVSSTRTHFLTSILITLVYFYFSDNNTTIILDRHSAPEFIPSLHMNDGHIKYTQTDQSRTS